MALGFLVFGPMLLAVFSYLIGRRSKGWRDVFVILSCLSILAAAVWLLLGVLRGESFTLTLPGVCGLGMGFMLDGFRALYVLIGAVMWTATAMLSKQYFAHHYHNRNRYYFFFLFTLGATLGVFLSADLYTTFIFFELMSFTSYTWVAHDETPGAMRAAQTYLAVAIFGGMVMLVGLFLLYFKLGTLTISELYHAAEACPDKGTLWAASLCILAGFGAKAGMFPLHIWLPKAHPVAPAPASALLSGILTKTGIFGVIAVSANIFRESAAWGNLILVLGLITMLGGAVLAVFSVNLKRTLACSSMSQIGFILTGIAMSCLLGEENALAARGTLLYMLNHSLFKLILFMAAGVVYLNLHKLDLNDVRGFGRGKPILHFAFLMGALGLMGVPSISGYVSKTLIHEGIVEYIEHLHAHGGLWLPYKAAEYVFLFSGGLTAGYMIKLYICLFWEKNNTRQAEFDTLNRRYMTPLSALALGLSALIPPVLGVRPNLTMDAIADFAGGFLHAAQPAHAVHYFSLTNLKGAGISLTIGVLVYFFFIRKLFIRREEAGSRYVDLWPAGLDLEDRVYRPAIAALTTAGGFLAAVGSEAILEKRIFKPLIALATAVGGGVAALGSEAVLEDLVFKPLIALLTLIGTFAARFCGVFTDTLAYVLGRTALATRHVIAHEHLESPGIAAVGRFADRMIAVFRRSKRRGEEGRTHFMGRLSGWWKGVKLDWVGVTHTMSYALLFFGLGLCATMIYLLLQL